MPILLTAVTAIAGIIFSNPGSSPVSVKGLESTSIQSVGQNGFSLSDDVTPDYYQRDTAFGGFPGSGAAWCGPVAVSNSLIRLSLNGFPELMKSTGNLSADQHAMISILGSSDYMNIRGYGSTVQDLCKGIKTYLESKHMRGKIESEGMYTVSEEFDFHRGAPDLSRLQQFVSGARAAWLNIGWYRYDRSNDTYIKTGGHWVTLVGYTGDRERDGDLTLVVHDPDTDGAPDEYIRTESINSGMISNGNDVLPWNAAGFHRFRTGRDRFGIIGGVVYLSLDLPRMARFSSNG